MIATRTSLGRLLTGGAVPRTRLHAPVAWIWRGRHDLVGGLRCRWFARGLFSRRCVVSPFRIEDLSSAEQAVWSAFPQGAAVDLRTGDADADDPAGGHAWSNARAVRAEVIAALLLGFVGQDYFLGRNLIVIWLPLAIVFAGASVVPRAPESVFTAT